MSHSQKNVVKINLSYTTATDADIIGRSSFSKQDEFLWFSIFQHYFDIESSIYTAGNASAFYCSPDAAPKKR